MIIRQQPPLHLTYCLNIHPGETWDENLLAINNYALEVKKRVAPDKSFGLGLRLSREAAESLRDRQERVRFRAFLEENGLYVFTINGFPYGRFHGTEVKANVYAPDWRMPERRDYTNLLADILADILPDGVTGSISTVPGSYKQWIENESDVKSMAAMLTSCAEHLAEIQNESGREISLGLEPEPDCYLESAEEVLRFFREQLLIGNSETDKQTLKHIGVCLDTCHAAMRFKDPLDVLRLYVDEGIRISKIQLSAALESSPDPKVLRPFSDPVYLHQATGIRSDGSLHTWSDLPDVLEKETDVETLRVHYHLPLYVEEMNGAHTTASLLTPEFFELARSGVTEHLEIETYTFEVMPGATGNVVDSIVREYQWVLARI